MNSTTLPISNSTVFTLIVTTLVSLGATGCAKAVMNAASQDSTQALSGNPFQSTSQALPAGSGNLKCEIYDLSPYFQAQGCPVPLNDPSRDPLALPEVPSSALAACGMKLPDHFDSIIPVAPFDLDQINVGSVDWTVGFPGSPKPASHLKEWYGVRCTADLKIQVGGNYTFTLNSDDGSRLFVDGRKTIDLDGLHAAQKRSGSVALQAGTHRISAELYQGPRYQIQFQLMWNAIQVEAGGPKSGESIREDLVPADRFIRIRD